MPLVSSRSLCATGSPCNGPSVSLRACISSAFEAAAAAISGTKVTIALTFGLTRSICLRCWASASRAESFFARISRAISTVLMKQTEDVSASKVSWRRGAAAIPSRISRRVALFVPIQLLYPHRFYECGGHFRRTTGLKDVVAGIVLAEYRMRQQFRSRQAVHQQFALGHR